MSTKSTIRSGDQWHLYEDVLESMILKQDDAIYLDLKGVHFTAGTRADQRGWVSIQMTRALAVELGLIKPDPKKA